MDLLTDIVFEKVDACPEPAGNGSAGRVFRAVAKADAVSVAELLAGTGMEEGALRDALGFLVRKGFVKSYVGLTETGREIASRVLLADDEDSPVAALARARASVRLKSAFAHDEATDRAHWPIEADWTMPPDRKDQRRFAWNADSEVDSGKGLPERTAGVLLFLRSNGPSRLPEIASATGMHAKAAAEELAHLAAIRLVVDASDGAEERARAWEAFCMQVLGSLGGGCAYPVSAVRDMLPHSEFAEVKAALRYLETRGALTMTSRGGQKLYALPSEDGSKPREAAPDPRRSPFRVARGRGRPRGPNWTRIEEMVAQGPVTQPQMAAALDVSYERVRQITEILVREGSIRLVPLKGKGRLRCFVRPDLEEWQVDEALAAAGFERADEGSAAWAPAPCAPETDHAEEGGFVDVFSLTAEAA